MARTHKLLLLVMLLVGLLALVLPAMAAPDSLALRKIRIADNFFSPGTRHAILGDTIGWKNLGAVSHTTTSDTAAWDSGIMAPGAVFGWTPTATGTYTYHCIIHPTMTGTVIVHPPPTEAGR